MNKKQFKKFKNLHLKILGKNRFIEESNWETLFNERLSPEERKEYKKLHNLYNLHLSENRKTQI